MKPKEVSHWRKNKYYSDFLLLVETMEEASFLYSFESYKHPALNCHFLCYDVVRTAHDIEKKVLLDGNFVPISEEFELLITHDPFIKHCFEDGYLLLFQKGKNMAYYDLAKQDIKAKLHEYKELANYIISKCQVKNAYYRFLCGTLIDSVFTDNSSYETKETIYNLTKMLITELVNNGYSQAYIHKSIQDFFFDPDVEIECTKDTLVNFFGKFTFSAFSFVLKFRVNNQLSLVFEKLDEFEISNFTDEESSLMKIQVPNAKCVVLRLTDKDEYSAYQASWDIIQTVLSFHNLNQHNSKLYVSSIAVVEKTDEGNIISKSIVNSNINLMKKRGNTSYLHALYNDIILLNKQQLPTAFYTAISLHSVAIECKDVSNQLLNLWTIVEVLITSKRDNEDRINTICKILCSILNRNYIYSQMERLLKDLEHCPRFDKSRVFSTLENMKVDDVEKLTLVLAVNKFTEQKTSLYSMVEEYPLLAHRIEKYSSYIFKDSNSIFEYLNHHTLEIC